MSKTLHDTTTRYRAETERAIAEALRVEYLARIAELRERIAVWEARIAGLGS